MNIKSFCLLIFIFQGAFLSHNKTGWIRHGHRNTFENAVDVFLHFYTEITSGRLQEFMEVGREELEERRYETWLLQTFIFKFHACLIILAVIFERLPYLLLPVQ